MPELEVQEAPDAIAAVRASLGVMAQQAIDRLRIDEAALDRTAVEQHVARNRVPYASRPVGERHGETHLRPVENRLRQQPLHRLAQHALGREARELPL